ncbi:MAG TPA: 2-amino-4-hydroxy-6-hydroxymethyldihydropteridine diphosphokinase [Acidobacteriota bacterium]|nr:2-amino-4-hydroxy-6-hydroxymethyldihydropteridine diphosphokinase [Acidobacteriota bacterium]
MAETVYILLGSNVGDREKCLRTALKRLESLEGMEVVAVSAVYVSPAEDMEEGTPAFLNQVIKGEYSYSPYELLRAVEKIEHDLGRTEKGENLPRTIDLDILLFGEQLIDSESLCIPYLQLLSRAFAMVPLLEIDPHLRHPASKRPIAEFLTDEDRRKVMLYKDHVARNV